MIEWSSKEVDIHMAIDIRNRDEAKFSMIQESCNYHATLLRKDFGDTLSILHMNVRSMKNKMDEIKNFLSNNIQWDVICISETWLKEDIVKYYDLEQYTLFATCRPRGEGGGTAIYVHVKHQAEERNDLRSIDIEATFVQVHIRTSLELRRY